METILICCNPRPGRYNQYEETKREALSKVALGGSIAILLHDAVNNLDPNKWEEAIFRLVTMTDKLFVVNPKGFTTKITNIAIDKAKKAGKEITYLDKTYVDMIGKRIVYKFEDKNGTIEDINVFEEDTFGQGDYMAKISTGDWLYPNEFKFVPED